MQMHEPSCNEWQEFFGSKFIDYFLLQNKKRLDGKQRLKKGSVQHDEIDSAHRLRVLRLELLATS